MFTILITFLSAISISVIAAGYSIVGLSTLFAGAELKVTVDELTVNAVVETPYKKHENPLRSRSKNNTLYTSMVHKTYKYRSNG